MDTPQPQPPALFPERTLRDLDLGCRIGFLVLTLILGYIAIRLSWSFSAGLVGKTLSEMIKGASIPLSMQIVQATHSSLLMLSAGLPVAAIIATLKVRRPLTALLISAACNLLLALISILLGTALMDTIGKIIASLD